MRVKIRCLFHLRVFDLKTFCIFVHLNNINKEEENIRDEVKVKIIILVFVSMKYVCL